MNLNDYETKHFSIYQSFAETVHFILEKALLADGETPRPQSIQCRAKGIDSLRRRLAEAGKLDTEMLECERRDLAGARLIFYTNNDVDHFLASPLISKNFEIEEGSARVHHPTPENKEIKYRAVHYTVRLREDRTGLPEYARFAGLRCEIQVQTILNHAWSETSHDILYKDKLSDGYGGVTMKGIVRRFERVMDKYLIPAGFEIQKAQQEYERVLQGKELFDKNIPSLLDNAQNNNERYEILSGLRDYAIPNYDDVSVAYKELKDPLMRAVKAARTTEPVSIETTYGNMKGFKADEVTSLVVEIVESLQADIIGTLQLFIDIYRDEPNEDTCKQIESAVKNLSEFNFETYKQVGPMLQMVLVDHLDGMSDAEVDSIRPIAIIIWTEAIQSNISGARWKADSVILSEGSVPASDQLREIRDNAIKALFAAYDRSTNDAQKRVVLSALEVAKSTPNYGQCSNELRAITLGDTIQIVNFVTERAKATSYELLQHLEHQFLHDYYRAESFAEDSENRFGCKNEAGMLMAAIIKFRDIINADDQFVRYKILVGFESVYPAHWIDKEFYQKAEEYRREQANCYIDEMGAVNEKNWLDLIERCAKTKSKDLATFLVFGDFISKLAERKPEVASRFLEKASDDLRKFLAGFLNGLAQSGQSVIYERILKSELDSAKNLSGVARHLRYSDGKKPDFAARLLKRAIDKGDVPAVNECLLFALKYYGTEKVASADIFLHDALTFLNDRKDSGWVSEALFLRKASKLYEELTPERTAQLLQNLGYFSQVTFQVECVLVGLAERQPEAIWDYFGARLSREAVDGEDEERFEAVPFRFHNLQEELSKAPQLAISKGLSWFRQDQKRFQFQGGRLLCNVFPDCPPEFAAVLAESVKTGDDTEADFALAILQNYRGEISTFGVLKEIVSRYPNDISKMSLVQIAIDNAGVVSGRFGFVEAWRAKKESLKEWMGDERPAVKAFAEKHISDLDLRIASEQRRAEADKEMRNRSYEEDDGSG